ncbi:MAG TPA: copper resistance protein B [Steroidobacteraceae bacterium]|nr:copper resistance protein B [Steroidobacteraceae bacterium]
MSAASVRFESFLGFGARAARTICLAILASALLHATSLHAQDHAHQQSDPGQSEAEHVPPAPPSSELGDMSYRTMVEMMDMDDKARVGKVLLDQLDWRDAEGATAFAWDVQAYYGTDYDKLWLKTEGERAAGATEDARLEVLWDRIVSRWWSTQAGVRDDFGEGPTRDWLAVGVQGLAPYFFHIEATAYLGDAGRTAARFKAEYELLFTQRLILTPELELNAYGKDDPERRIMSGVSDAELSLRLRYEIRREIAPYVGVAWVHRFGRTADLVRAAGDDPSDVQALAGIRVWF